MKIALFFKVKIFFIKEQIQVFRNFYKEKNFIGVDMCLFLFSFFYNPYRVCKIFWKKQGFLERVYGETPLSVFSNIAKWAEIGEKETFLEMGSGRGKLCFWIASFLKCQVIGVEKVPLFHKASLFLQKRLYPKKVVFLQKDFLELDYSPYSFIYFYATAQKEEYLEKVFLKMLCSQKGAKILTVSVFPSEFFPKDFKLLKKKEFLFPWGEAEIFLSEKK